MLLFILGANSIYHYCVNSCCLKDIGRESNLGLEAKPAENHCPKVYEVRFTVLRWEYWHTVSPNRVTEQNFSNMPRTGYCGQWLTSAAAGTMNHGLVLQLTHPSARRPGWLPRSNPNTHRLPVHVKLEYK